MPDPVLPRETGGKRITWAALPAQLRVAIEHRLGDTVVSAASQPGGFSEGLATRVRLTNGRRVFIKAADARAAPAEAEFHRQEINVSTRLPDEVPTPRLVDAFDHGTWVVLMFEDIPGRLPEQPWRHGELDRVLRTVTELARKLTPSPVAPEILGKPRLGGWRLLRDDHDAVTRLAELSPWAADHLDELTALDDLAAHELAGETLLHGDLYPFNIMLAADRVCVVDWPHAWIGAGHCDVVTLLSSAQLSGVDPQPLVEVHPLTCRLDASRIDVMLAAHAGFLLRIVTSVGPGADPNLVDMMVSLGRSSLHWLRSRRRKR